MNTRPAPVAFDGQCGFAVSLDKSGVEGSPRHKIVDDGTTYYFKNGVARLLWRVLPGRKEKAIASWTASHPATTGEDDR